MNQQHNNMQNNSGASLPNSQQLQQERHSQINQQQSSETVNNVRLDGNPKKRMLSQQQHQMVKLAQILYSDFIVSKF